MRKKKNSIETLKTIGRIIKKSSDAEKKKSEEKKKIKQSKPKGLMARRMGMFAFWAMFLFMFLVTVVSVFGGGSAGYDQTGKNERTKLMENEGVEFAKSFVHEYFNWNIGKHGEDDLEMRISPYLLADLDPLAGIGYNREWSSSVDKRDIVLKDVQEIDKNKARFIFKVKITMKSPTEEKNTKIDEERLSFEDVLKEKSKVRVVDGYKVKEMTKYISVPVYYNEELDRFAVFELPSFTYVDEEKMYDDVKTEFYKLQTLSDTYTENNVNSFLTTFFESYSKDNKDKLSYILEDKKHVNGLNGTMQFSKINRSTIYIIDDNHDRFLVDVEVEMIEPTTKYTFNNKYLVVVKRKDQRYVVESLNDEKYVYDLIEKYLKQFESEEESSITTETNTPEDSNTEYEYEGEKSNDELNDIINGVENEENDMNELEEAS